MIPFLDLKKINLQYEDQLQEAAKNVIKSGYYLLGENVKLFEKNLASYIGVSHAVGVANGLDALRLIFRAYIELGIMKPGDEIIVPANTYIASILSITDNQLIPIFVEPELETYNLSVENIEKNISSKTKAILLVHLYGKTCWSDSIKELSLKYNLKIIEDNAQAIGASYIGFDFFKKTGSLGDASAFSFYPGKNLGALGDGGAILSNDSVLINLVRAISNYGSSKKYINDFKGLNSRLDEIQAVFLNIKLNYIDRENLYRNKIASLYISNIRNTSIVLPSNFDFSSCKLGILEHVWHLFVVRCNKREKFQEYLLVNGIQTLIHYPVPPHKQKAYSEFNNLKLPKTELIHKEVISLPISPVIEINEINYIIDIINKFDK
jgi:dTDP-4-amino-4,6-dideoxygalactose transaminase